MKKQDSCKTENGFRQEITDLLFCDKDSKKTPYSTPLLRAVYNCESRQYSILPVQDSGNPSASNRAMLSGLPKSAQNCPVWS